MIKLFALNLMAVSFLASCSHSSHKAHSHSHSKEKTEACKLGDACKDAEKKDCCKS